MEHTVYFVDYLYLPKYQERDFACFVHPKIVGKDKGKIMDKNVFFWKSDQSLLELLIVIQSGSHLWMKTVFP